jgi:hypothetical protein
MWARSAKYIWRFVGLRPTVISITVLSVYQDCPDYISLNPTGINIPAHFV